MFFNQKVIKLKVNAQSNTEIITVLAKMLKQKNIVKDGYLTHVLDREKNFPTGLQLEKGVGIAIPHTDSEYVNTSQIAIATLKKPVIFKSMVNQAVDVKVSLVFMIAMSQPHEQAQLLSNLMNFCQNQQAITELLTSKDSKKVVQILNKYDLK